MPATDPKNPPSVPQGWLAKYDDKYKVFFYIDLRTKKSQWEAPASTSFEKSAHEVLPPPYSPHESNSPQPPILNQTRPNPQQQVPFQGYGQSPQQYVQQLPQNPHMSGMGLGGGLLGGMLIGNMMRTRRRTSCPPRRRRRC